MADTHGRVSTMHLVLLALLNRGGDEAFVTTDEVAIEAFRLFPGKFCWNEYPHLPHWDRVRQWLSEAKKAKHGTLVEGFSGDRRDGWRLTAAGVRLLRFKQDALSHVECAPAPAERYEEIASSNLVIAALSELAGTPRKGGVPLLVARCYMRFPNAFELPGYEGWPDASRVRQALDDAVAGGFVRVTRKAPVLRLTGDGKRRAKEIRKRVSLGAARISLDRIGKGLAGRAASRITEITATRGWRMHEVGEPFTKAAACEALRCTLQSHPKAIRRALGDYQLAAEQLDREDVLAFLEDCAVVVGLVMPTGSPQGGKEGEDGPGDSDIVKGTSDGV